MAEPRSVGILIFDEVEVLDFCGPFEVFSVASSRSSDEIKPFRVFTVGKSRDSISTRGGMAVTPQASIDEVARLDILLVPGGQGTRPLLHDTQLIDWIRSRAGTAELVLSVCTGALLLGKAGLLDGLTATTHHGAIELLGQVAPQCTVRKDVRYVDNGRVITSGGIAAGIDMSLYVVARLLGRDHAAATARYMEYPWSGEV